MKKSSIIVFLIAVVIVCLIGLGIWHKISSRKYHKPTPPTVTVMKITAKINQSSIKTVGTSSAIHGVTLRTAISGQVTKIHFKSNEEVKKGQLLVEVDPDQLQADLISNQAKLEQAYLTIKRDKALLVRDAISQSIYDENNAIYKQAVAAVAKAKAILKQAMITAPFSGKIGIRKVQVGDYLSVGDTITTLTQLNPLWIDFNLPTKDLPLVKTGQTVKIHNEAYPNKTFTGKVLAISPQVDSDSDSFIIRAVIKNTNKLLLSGQLVNVKLLVGKATPKIMIPAIAIIYDNNGTSVYIVHNNKATLTPVTIGEQIGQQLIITKGLKAGETIVVDGTNKLHGHEATIAVNNTNNHADKHTGKHVDKKGKPRH